MPSVLNTRRFGLCLARAAAVLGVVVLICVPALTRVGQKLETASHAPSFSRNIDCPPKKVTVTPALAIASVSLNTLELVPCATLASPQAETVPRSPQFTPPAPLRAPPSALLS